MPTPPKGRKAVETAVTALQARLADGDPADAALRRDAEASIEGLRAAYRADPKAFTPDSIEALKELVELLRDSP